MPSSLAPCRGGVRWAGAAGRNPGDAPGPHLDMHRINQTVREMCIIHFPYNSIAVKGFVLRHTVQDDRQTVAYLKYLEFIDVHEILCLNREVY